MAGIRKLLGSIKKKARFTRLLLFGLTNKKLLFTSLLIIWSFGLLLYGRVSGLENAFKIAEERERELERQLVAERQRPTLTPSPSLAPKPQPEAPRTAPTYSRRVSWGGVELWEAVSKKRREYGVGGLGRDDLLCSIASYRLSQLLERGSLDNHAGFNELWKNESSPFYWARNKYSKWEFLVYMPNGTAEDAVSAWDNTLGHQTLLRGGQFTVGCTYAQNGFGVAIVGF